MLKKGNTLHFINRIDESNRGDMVACPLMYYYDDFKPYRMKRHDIGAIDFDSIAPGDVIILGGGGMLDYAEALNREINRVLDTGATVISWSLGFNRHEEYGKAFETKIDFNRFALATVRDYQNEYHLDYLPDVSCKLPGLRKKYEIRRRFGIARHKDYPVEGFDFESVTNNAPIDTILQFIGESEIILSNSFHLLYWSMLMGKKTICVNPFSTKFQGYKYKPAYYGADTDDLESCAEKAKNYQILDECVQANNAFFERVRELVQKQLQPAADDRELFQLVTREGMLSAEGRKARLQKGDLLASRLFIDSGSGFSETKKQIAINNVYGDDVHTVRFDLSSYQNVRALRFDPVESQSCAVEILSATADTGAVPLAAQTARRVDGWDRFLTTDPQYLITFACGDHLEITFRLKTMSLFEAEQNAGFYVEETNAQAYRQRERLEGLQTQLGTQSAELLRRAEQIDRQQRQLETQQTQLETQSAELLRRAEQIDRQQRQLETQQTQLETQSAELLRRAEQIDGQQTQLEELRNSASWKLTLPLRATMDFGKRMLKGIR